jgi:hypothetical protein
VPDKIMMPLRGMSQRQRQQSDGCAALCGRLSLPGFGLVVCVCRYDFTDGDLTVSLAQLHEYLDTYEAPPYR